MTRWIKRIFWITIIIILLIAGAVAVTFIKDTTPLTQINSQTEKLGEFRATDNCRKIDQLQFTYDFTELDRINGIAPLGSVNSGELRSHTFIAFENPSKKIAIYAPTVLTLISGNFRNASGQDEYALIFQASCDYFLKFDHITDPIEAIRKVFPATPSAESKSIELKTNVDIAAGEVVAYTSGNYPNNIWDFGLYDLRQENTFANPARFMSHLRLRHAICPYDFFPKKERYYAKLRFEGETYGDKPQNCGSLNQDIIGTISGSWFSSPVEAFYNSEAYLGISTFTSPDEVRIVGLQDRDFYRIGKTNPTFKDPTEVTNEHCYANQDGIVYFKLLTRDSLAVYFANTSACPDTFPSSGFVTYMR
ncbi:hypothetical protein HYW32_00370 [Candidatus Berkelbacteria bacterium]|nr:hypothetical protein [Candidatus Berkelbacteria bacterium]